MMRVRDDYARYTPRRAMLRRRYEALRSGNIGAAA